MENQMPYDFLESELLSHTIAFLKHIDAHLSPDTMTYSITEKDVADFFGTAIGIVRVARALNQLTKMRFEVENSLEWIICSLLNTCAFRKERNDLYISFTSEGRMILRTLDVDTILRHLR
jgi:hypothetical protein